MACDPTPDACIVQVQRITNHNHHAMTQEFARELRLTRRKAGYTQSDIAHLLNCPQSLISDLENERGTPTLEQIIRLSITFGRSFEAFFENLLEEQRKALWTRLATLPELKRHTAETFNRSHSVKQLRQRLREAEDIDYGP